MMPVARFFTAALAIGLLAGPAVAADSPPHRGTCLSKTEQRAAVATHKAISLAQALKNLRSQGHRAEVVGARLCRKGDGLVYVLTLFARNGKVTRTSVDAANGELITGR
ncbi:MAG TPA: hypothetical protein VGJ01_09600 [Pseudolabrys sp.]|jgi:uncharacterized membrane protein YkoI